MSNVDIDKIVTNFTDSDVAAYKQEVISFLRNYLYVFDTHSMNETILFLHGQKDMLEKIIIFLERS